MHAFRESKRRWRIAAAVVAGLVGVALIIAVAWHPPDPSGAAAEPARQWPRTTDGAVAMANLDAQIRHWSAQEDARLEPARRGALIDALLTRARVRLSMDDLLAAQRWSQDWTERAADLVPAWLARSAAHAAVHEYAAARAALDRASTLGPAPAQQDAIAVQRCGLRVAMGEALAALDCARRLAAAQPSTASLGHLAGVIGTLGDPQRAGAMFHDAGTALADVSPFPLAWLALAEGRMWMQAGEPARALTAFNAGLTRLPDHLGLQTERAVALAANGQVAAAQRALREVLEATDDPDPAALLASLLPPSAERDALIDRARQGYTTRLERLPLAYAAHAAEFWLGVGDDPARARQWARRNAENAPTVAALRLLVQAQDGTTADTPSAPE